MTDIASGFEAKKRTYSIFITHAWRYHADWTHACDMFERDDGAIWRNFSIPWHDPAFDANTPLGKTRLRQWLESQIRPASAVLFLDSVYAVKSTRKWLDLEVAIARDLGLPVFGLPAAGAEAMSPEAAAMCDETVEWDPSAVAAALARRSEAGRTDGYGVGAVGA
jgi:hypothetical protein